MVYVPFEEVKHYLREITGELSHIMAPDFRFDALHKKTAGLTANDLFDCLRELLGILQSAGATSSRHKPKIKLQEETDSIKKSSPTPRPRRRPLWRSPSVVESGVIPLCIPDNFTWNEENNSMERSSTQRSRNKLVACKQAMDILRNIHDPLCVVCVVGAARTGKSYLLGQLQGGTFRLGHTMKAETMGIWMGLKPSSHTLATGQQVRVLMLDSEGIGSADSEESSDKTDNQIFTLSVLISSILVYNTKHVPTSSDLEKLNYISNLSASIQIKSQGENTEDDADRFRHQAPEFFWVIRDVSLTMVDKQNKPCDAKTYIKQKVLKRESGLGSTTRKKNEVRDAITKFFSDIDAIALPPPSDNPAVLQNMEKYEFQDKINQNFRVQMNILKSKVSSKLTPKKGLNGRWLTGTEIADLIEIYLEALNSENGVPNWESAWENTIRLAYQRADTDAFNIYKSQVDPLRSMFPCDETDMYAVHTEALATALTTFRKMTSVDTNIQNNQRHQRGFADRCAKYDSYSKTCVGGYLASLIAANWESSRTYCENEIEHLKKAHLQPLLDNISHETSITDMQDALVNIERKYQTRARGPAANEVMDKYILWLQDEQKRVVSTLQKMKGYDDQLHKEKMAKMKAEAEIRRQEDENVRLQGQKEAMARQHEQELESFKQANEDNMAALRREREAALKDLETRMAKTHSDALGAQLKMRQEEHERQVQCLQQAQNNIQEQLNQSRNLIRELQNRKPEVVTVERGGGKRCCVM